MKKIAILIFLFFFSGVSSSQAYSVYCTNCSSQFMQALQYAIQGSKLAELKKAYDEYISQTAQQIKMVQQNIEQYANMVQNTVKLPSNLIQEISGELTKLGRVTSALNTLRDDVQGMASVFDQLYKTQDQFKNLANLPKELLTGSGGASEQYGQYWDDWSKRVDESTKATFQVSASQLKDLEETGRLESYINSLLSTPDGQQKAIMAGNQLAAIQIQEARQLRELVATKTQSDLASQEKAEKEAQYSKELARALTDFSNINTRPVEDKGY